MSKTSEYIQLSEEKLDQQHICCAISDKKCGDSYQAKKDWLKTEFKHGYVFKRLDERAKVFIEYGPAEHSWQPVDADNYMLLGCFWVSGKYKGQGHGKALLAQAVKDAKQQGMQGIATVVGGPKNKKFHFMSDAKWLLSQGFTVADSLPTGFQLLRLDFTEEQQKGQEKDQSLKPIGFKSNVKNNKIKTDKGCLVYYSNRCPFAEYHVKNSLVQTCAEQGIKLTSIKLDTRQKAQSCPTPATIFSLYLDGKFITTDLSACMPQRFAKLFK